MSSLNAESITLAQADVVQVAYEMPGDCREALLPPALHPTDPPLVTWLVYRCAASPWGPFTMAQTRIECRSGLRLRAFLVLAVVDNPDAAAGLRDARGYRVRHGSVALQRYYDAIRLSVTAGDTVVLDLSLADPDPLAAADIQYVANMHAAQTTSGLRLLQVEHHYEIHRAERCHPKLLAFAGDAWGDSRLKPVYPVSASVAVADVTLPPLRFMCRPDVLAFEGTERVS